jgi:hypothetical protein
VTAPTQQQRGDHSAEPYQNDTFSHTPVVPVVPVVPASMEAYLAYRAIQHRHDQEAIAADLVKKFIGTWELQQFDDLDRSTVLWLSAAIPEVKTAYLQSQLAQAVYSYDVRMASLPDEDPLPMQLQSVQLPRGVDPLHFDASLIPSMETADQPAVTFDEFPTSDAALSLTITGNYNVKAQMPGPEDELMANGRTNSAGASVRHAMNGGRNVVEHLMSQDRKVVGYARVTDADPCAFCALLASRGAVYGQGSFIKGNKRFKANPNGAKDLPDTWTPARTHDHCRCFLRPVYAKAQAMDAEAKFYRDQWENTQRKWYWLDNKQQIEKFREQYTPYDKPAPQIKDITKELKARASSLSSAGKSPLSPQVQWANRQLDQLA